MSHCLLLYQGLRAALLLKLQGELLHTIKGGQGTDSHTATIYVIKVSFIMLAEQLSHTHRLLNDLYMCLQNVCAYV